MAMKHSPVHVFWNVWLVLHACWGLQSDSESDLCLYGESMDYSTSCHRDTSGEMQQIPLDQECHADNDFHEPACLLYPTNMLNCTIASFQNSTQAFASISTCDGNKTISYENWTLKEAETLKTGITSAILVHTVKDNIMSSIILRINVTNQSSMSLTPDTWTIYYNKWDIAEIEVLSPPANINISMTSRSRLNVSWDLPVRRSGEPKAACFKYDLDINGDKKERHVEGKQLYEEDNVDPTRSYKVKIRTKNTKCSGPVEEHWSEWSDTITLDPGTPRSNTRHWSEWSDTITLDPGTQSFNWVILAISLGIPMVLLSVLLLVRSCRVSNVLFPRVPQPPLKYKAFLENAALHFPPAVQSPDSVEQISEVICSPLKRGADVYPTHQKSDMHCGLKITCAAGYKSPVAGYKSPVAPDMRCQL